MPASYGGTAALRPARSASERAGEAELVPVAVLDVEVPLAPGRVGGHGARLVAGGAGSAVDLVDVRDPEDDPAPDLVDRRVPGVELQVQEAVTGAERREGAVGTAAQELEAERLVEVDGGTHVGG